MQLKIGVLLLTLQKLNYSWHCVSAALTSINSTNCRAKITYLIRGLESTDALADYTNSPLLTGSLTDITSQLTHILCDMDYVQYSYNKVC